MLDIAGGVILGVVVLWILAAFAEPILKLVIWCIGIGIAIFFLWLVVEFFAGAWHLIERGPVKSFATADISDKVFLEVIGLAFMTGILIVWTEITQLFPMTRWAIGIIRRKLHK